jgi:hypothetical protein
MKLKCNILATRILKQYKDANLWGAYCHNESKEKDSRLMLKTWSFVAI